MLEGGEGNCCTWDGVQCDAESGHVIGLDICCTGLHASINSSSSGLLRLVHLRKLNLAYTNLDRSPIPYAIGNLPGLTSLNLSNCELAGQIPEPILSLTSLSTLDLSYNDGLELVKPSLEDLALRLTKLEILDLSNVNIPSALPYAITSSPSLTSLTLAECGLEGRLPPSVFSLPNLQVLDIYGNDLSGELPTSVSNLTELILLDLSYNRFQGRIPRFSDTLQLRFLNLRNNMFTGAIPSSLHNVSELEYLSLANNHLTGQIPSQIANLGQLTILDLSCNMLSGEVLLHKFLELKNLETLHIGYNDLSVLTSYNTTTTSHPRKLLAVSLAHCNLREFPKLLLSLQRLSVLGLSSNKIQGEVPMWFQNVSRQSLVYLKLSNNSLTGFEGNPVNLKWANLAYLDLSFNKLQGPLPAPPDSISIYLASNNRFSGDIPPLLCSMEFIEMLDLAHNNFSGVIPRCFSNLTRTLDFLSLNNNNLQGEILQVPGKNCSVRVLDLHSNQLQGKLPRSLSNCTGLEFLNVGNNMINDTFPSWLGTSTNLRALVLRSNRFHGSIEEPETNSEFQSLQIIDISSNNFEDFLPAKYFRYWTSMRESITEGQKYFHVVNTIRTSHRVFGNQSLMDIVALAGLTVETKGMEVKYAEILGYLQAIDFSGNNFRGEIPESIADLKGLRSLNFSDNNLSGPIPPTLGGMTNLESLDLSGNGLSGEIPQQLSQLYFLEFFNVSNNRLSGPIPQGRQFYTFKNTSYEGNERLCGVPLSRACDSGAASSPSYSRNQKGDSGTGVQLGWKGSLVGYAVGFISASVIGHRMMTSELDWFSNAVAFVEQRKWW
ncbi:hypothetical protein SAY87_002113 [Trapa incisa]|uniref:Receptor-like protein 12 n=1 Tax=Trapa incisa TaxID=236973 RepID=A0AAN7PUE9_9MYRT|nr:hypothetical protein SAY87_002113 [Trapa incisa]